MSSLESCCGRGFRGRGRRNGAGYKARGRSAGYHSPDSGELTHPSRNRGPWRNSRVGLTTTLAVLVALLSAAPPAGSLPEKTATDDPPLVREQPTVVTRREHIREHEDGRYIGQTRTETRVVLHERSAVHERPAMHAPPIDQDAPRADDSTIYDGRGFEGVELRFADTIRDRAPVGRPVEFSREFAFVLDSDGRRVHAGEYLDLPSIWGFPAPPPQRYSAQLHSREGDRPEAYPPVNGSRQFDAPASGSLEPGTRWSAPGEYRVARSAPRSEAATGDPDALGKGAAFPFVAEYRYEGTELRDGKELHVVSAGFRVRYPLSTIPEFDNPAREEREREYRAALSARAASAGIAAVEATHRATILFTTESWRPVLVNENIAQQIRTLDGRDVRREGFQLHWYRHPQPLQLPELLRRAERLDLPDTRIEQRPGGIVVTLEAIGFEPDSARLQPRERERLREVAELLQNYRGAPVLAIGHTAEAGTEEGRQALSERRAEVVTEELIAAGIDPARLFFEGRGAREPVAENADEDGRRRNRRVELFILDDQTDPDR